MPSGKTLYSVEVRPRLAEVEEGWRERVRGQMEGEASNQGTDYGTTRPFLHNGLYYRSKSEAKVAEALEQVDGLLFFPNSGAMSRGVIKEPDFLVFHNKKAGWRSTGRITEAVPPTTAPGTRTSSATASS